MPKGVKDLRKALQLGSQAEWIEWLQSGLVKPYWVALWEEVIKDSIRERGVGLQIVQRRLAHGESGGKRKFSTDEPETESWDSIDFYARFLHKVKSVNWADHRGVFYRKNFSDQSMDAMVWSLKEVLRQMHAPSQINNPKSGGRAVFGLNRGRWSPCTRLMQLTLVAEEGEEEVEVGEKRKKGPERSEGRKTKHSKGEEPRDGKGRYANAGISWQRKVKNFKGMKQQQTTTTTTLMSSHLKRNFPRMRHWTKSRKSAIRSGWRKQSTPKRDCHLRGRLTVSKRTSHIGGMSR